MNLRRWLTTVIEDVQFEVRDDFPEAIADDLARERSSLKFFMEYHYHAERQFTFATEVLEESYNFVCQKLAVLTTETDVANEDEAGIIEFEKNMKKYSELEEFIRRSRITLRNDRNKLIHEIECNINVCGKKIDSLVKILNVLGNEN